MRYRLLLLTVGILLFASSVYAAAYGVMPVISAKFTEEVNLIDYYFYNKDLMKSYDAEFIGVIEAQHKYSFQPVRALDNGAYDFVLIAEDAVGNEKEYRHPFSVFEPETRILLTEPNSLGYAGSSPFNVSVFSSKRSACKYSGVPVEGYDDIKAKPFDVTGNLSTGELVSDHTITDFDVKPDFPKRLFVVCRDELGRDTITPFTLHTDPNPPVLQHVAFSPNPVVEYPESGPLSSLLRVASDEPIICKYSTSSNLSYEQMVTFPMFDRKDIETFRSVQENVLTFPEDTVKDDFQYFVQCEDRAGHLSDRKPVTLTIDLTQSLSIRVNSPPKSSRNTSVFLNVTTNKRAYCMYKGSPPDPSSFTAPTAALSSDIDDLSRHHWKDLGVRSSGNHSIDILCIVPEGVGVEAQEGRRSYKFIIDTTPPSTPVVDALSPVCDNTLKATFNATDSESGISHYKWAVGGAGTIFNNGTTESASVEVSAYSDGTPFNLSDDGSYSFSVSAVDKAGNEGEAGISNTITYDSSGVSCDYTPPTITVSKSAMGDSVTIECYDNKSGCSSLGSFYGTSYEEPCIPSQYYLPPVTVPLFKSTIVCYNISDTAGNRAVGSKMITLNKSTMSEEQISCEAGIDNDGDGYGERCPLGPDCDDTDPNISIGCPNGCIMDLDGDGYGIGCDSGNDCNGQDASLTTECPNGCISDNDGDEYGLHCDNGPDCKGDDSTLTTQCPNGCFDDNDGDSYGINCPVGFDCHGEDPDKMTSCNSSCIQDTDGDGFGIGCTSGLDCDGSDPGLTISCTNGCLFDEDGDGYGLGCDLGNDCHGLNVFTFEDCANGCIVDNDGDAHGWGCGLGADCDDTNPRTSLDCSATTDCVYDHDADGYGPGCAEGPDCDEFDWDIFDETCESNCTYDEDCNGLADDWQTEHFNNTICNDSAFCGRDSDPDEDGFTNIQEYRRGSDPLVKEEAPAPPPVEEEDKEDADEDGMPDACEVSYGLNPSDPFDAEADDDFDTLSNRFECTYTSGACADTWLNPKNEDTDMDGYTDDVEIDQGFDPCDPESHPSKFPFGLILLILGLLMVLGSVGYIIYKRYYIPLISPPPSPKPAAKPAAKPKAPSPGKRPPRHLAPRRHVVHHRPRPKPKPKGPLMSREKFLEAAKKKAEEREKIFSKFGGKPPEHKGHKHEEVKKHLTKRPHHVKHHVRHPVSHKRHRKAAKQRPARKSPSKKKPEEKPMPKDHVEKLTKLVGPDYFERISDLSKKEGDYFGKLTKIVKDKDIPLEKQYVDKLAKVSKEIEKKTDVKPQKVEKAFEKSEVDRLDDFLDSRKHVSTFLEEYAEEEVKEEKEKKKGGKGEGRGTEKGSGKKGPGKGKGRKEEKEGKDEFDRLSEIGEGKKADFESLESLSKKKRDEVIGSLENLSSKKAQETALSKMTEVSGVKGKDELFKTFKKISREKHVDKDVFAILFDYMLKAGKISKHDISDILFKLEEDGVLDKKDVSDVFFSLGMKGR